MALHKKRPSIPKFELENIERSKDRIKQTGEVFTPLDLVDDILEKLPDDVWDDGRKFIDPACGDGNFLVRVVDWKMYDGLTADQALRTTYGVELMDDNTIRARMRVLRHAFFAETGSDDFTTKQFRKFEQKHWNTVERRIVNHDALLYHYRFDDTPCGCSVCTRAAVDSSP